MKPFFMVYVECGNSPRKQHETLELAQKEAERLCRKEQKPAYVLMALMRCSILDQPMMWESIGEDVHGRVVKKSERPPLIIEESG